MNQKSIALLMACSLLWQFNATAITEQSEVDFGDCMKISEQDESEMVKSKKCKKFRSIKACNACISNLNVSNLTISGATAASSLSRSVIPFASGFLTIGSTPIPTIPLTGLVMGFGDSSLVPVAVPSGVVPNATGYAFTVPEAGTLFNLRGSVDSVYPIALGAATPVTFTFTVLQSHCANGSVSSYASTTLTAAASTTTPAGTIFPLGILTEGVTGCGSSSGSITVAAGDRITILVTPSVTVTTATLSSVAFSAGLEFSPAA